MEPRVLSIQSHVVHGYVGNRCAVYPLQLLGFEVDAINSVQFCCHTGYKHWQGQTLEADDLSLLFDGLKLNGIESQYTHILTAYCRSESWLRKVAEIVQQVRQKNPGLIFVCDPVLGDHGAYYVPEMLMPIYRDIIIPLADIVTPNQFEASQLTGIDIRSESDAWCAMDILHAKGCKVVVISSTDLGDNSVLVTFGSKVNAGGSTCGEPQCERIRMELPRIPLDFLGTGDLFTALLMAWLYKTDNNLKLACDKAQSTMQAVLKRTAEYAFKRTEPASSLTTTGEGTFHDDKKLDGSVEVRPTDREPPVVAETAAAAAIMTPPKVRPSMYDRELRLVQSKADIESPPDLVRAQKCL